jgi:hypothetical protein
MPRLDCATRRGCIAQHRLPPARRRGVPAACSVRACAGAARGSNRPRLLVRGRSPRAGRTHRGRGAGLQLLSSVLGERARPTASRRCRRRAASARRCRHGLRHPTEAFAATSPHAELGIRTASSARTACRRSGEGSSLSARRERCTATPLVRQPAARHAPRGSARPPHRAHAGKMEDAAKPIRRQRSVRRWRHARRRACLALGALVRQHAAPWR